jgi:hypothetical protein
MVAVLLTEVWLVLRYKAKGDAEKLAKAEKWNPVNVSKTSAAGVSEQAAKRQGKNQPPAVQFNQREDYRDPAE